MLNYITFRLYESFDKNYDIFSLARKRTLAFLLLFEVSLFIPLGMVINLFIHFDPKKLFMESHFRYGFGIIVVILIILNYSNFNRNLKNSEDYLVLYDRFHKEKYLFKTWMIFVIPFINIFVIPIIYGVKNGHLGFLF